MAEPRLRIFALCNISYLTYVLAKAYNNFMFSGNS